MSKRKRNSTIKADALIRIKEGKTVFASSSAWQGLIQKIGRGGFLFISILVFSGYVLGVLFKKEGVKLSFSASCNCSVEVESPDKKMGKGVV